MWQAPNLGITFWKSKSISEIKYAVTLVEFHGKKSIAWISTHVLIFYKFFVSQNCEENYLDIVKFINYGKNFFNLNWFDKTDVKKCENITFYIPKNAFFCRLYFHYFGSHFEFFFENFSTIFMICRIVWNQFSHNASNSNLNLQ